MKMAETQTDVKNHEEYVRELISQLGSPLEAARKKAMNDLSALDDPKSIKTLAGYISHKDNLVRYSVRRALNDIKRRQGDNFEKAGNEVISLTSAPGEKTEKSKSGGINLIFIVSLLILFQAGLAAYYFTRLAPNDLNHNNKTNKNSVSSLALPDPSKYNIVRFNKNSVAIIKIKGTVINKNSISRNALVAMSNSTAKCLLNFKEDMKMNFQTGESIEAEGELLRNDNIGPVLMQCLKIRSANNK